MSLPYPFPFWVLAEQKAMGTGGYWLYRWPSLTWQNYISIQDLVPDIAYFLVLKRDINLPTNPATHDHTPPANHKFAIPARSFVSADLWQKIGFFEEILALWFHYKHLGCSGIVRFSHVLSVAL